VRARILGPLRVDDRRGPLAIGGPKPRMLRWLFFLSPAATSCRSIGSSLTCGGRPAGRRGHRPAVVRVAPARRPGLGAAVRLEHRPRATAWCRRRHAGRGGIRGPGARGSGRRRAMTTPARSRNSMLRLHCGGSRASRIRRPRLRAAHGCPAHRAAGCSCREPNRRPAGARFGRRRGANDSSGEPMAFENGCTNRTGSGFRLRRP
jgi:hypothetical protein